MQDYLQIKTTQQHIILMFYVIFFQNKHISNLILVIQICQKKKRWLSIYHFLMLTFLLLKDVHGPRTSSDEAFQVFSILPANRSESVQQYGAILTFISEFTTHSALGTNSLPVKQKKKPKKPWNCSFCDGSITFGTLA